MPTAIDYRASAPFFKRMPVRESDSFPILRNSQNVTGDNLSASSLSFYPTDPPGSVADDNYTRNPLPGNTEHDIVGLGFDFSNHTLIERSGTSYNILHIINQLKHAEVLLTADEDRKQFVRGHLTQYLDFDRMNYEAASVGADNAGDNDIIRGVTLRSRGVLRLEEPITLDVNERFELDVTFENSDAFPTSEGDWDDDVLKLIAFIQVTRAAI